MYLTGKLLAGFVLSILVTLTLAFASYSFLDKLITSGRNGTVIQQIILESERAKATLLDMEVNLLRFDATSEQSFLDDYARSQQKMRDDVSQLRAMASGYPELDSKIAEVDSMMQQNIVVDTTSHDKKTVSTASPARFDQFSKQVSSSLTEIILLSNTLKKIEQAKVTDQLYGFGQTFIALLLVGVITPGILAYSLNKNLKQRVRAEEKLKQALAAVHDLYENAPCGYFSIDSQGMISNINTTLLQWLGFRRTEIVNRLHVNDLLQGGSVMLTEALSGEQTFVKDLEFQMTDKRDGIIHVIVNAIATGDRKARDFNIRLSVMDNTERKIAQDERDQLHADLEAFSYSVSHDLRAPLRSINGYVECLYEDYADKLEPGARQFLDVISRNAKKMGMLIDDLLGFSKVQRTSVAKSPISMDEIVRTIAVELLEQDQNKNIELDIRSLGTVVADLPMIRQVWVNLISNALKYSRKADRPRIVIGVEETNNEKVFYIKDNGAGFDMKYADKLFGVFQRLHKQEDFEGTGVGLALVKKIVEKHNGRIWAEAAVGRGASFFFSLPSNNGSTQKAIHFASETKANS
jgi:signal transduction histidine kinase/CHASE3 domain sensor protein